MNRVFKGLYFLAICAISVVAFGQSIEELNGEWKVTSGVLEGVAVPEASMSSMQLKFTSGTFDAKSGDLSSGGNVAIAEEGTFNLNFTISRGSDAGKTVKALYQIRDGVLTITYSQNNDFPLNHISTAENKYCVLQYGKGEAAAEDDSGMIPGAGGGDDSTGLGAIK